MGSSIGGGGEMKEQIERRSIGQTERHEQRRGERRKKTIEGNTSGRGQNTEQQWSIE